MEFLGVIVLIAGLYLLRYELMLLLLLPPSISGLSSAQQSAMSTLSLVSGAFLAILAVLFYVSGKISSALDGVKGAVNSAIAKLNR